MKKRKISASVDTKIRMKEPLRRRLEHAAKTHGVSMNAEMIERLQRTFNYEDARKMPPSGLTEAEIRQWILDDTTACFDEATK